MEVEPNTRSKHKGDVHWSYELKPKELRYDIVKEYKYLKLCNYVSFACTVSYCVSG